MARAGFRIRVEVFKGPGTRAQVTAKPICSYGFHVSMSVLSGSNGLFLFKKASKFLGPPEPLRFRFTLQADDLAVRHFGILNTIGCFKIWIIIVPNIKTPPPNDSRPCFFYESHFSPIDSLK